MRLNRFALFSQGAKSIRDVVIVGAGPVGLTLSALLSKYGITNKILEARKELTNHPQAHFINHRSMEIFKSLSKDLSQRIQQKSPPLEQWRKFIYSEYLTKGFLGEVDHFPGQFTSFNLDWSPEPVIHLSQDKLVRMLYDQVVTTSPLSTVAFECKAIDILQRDDCVKVEFEDGGRLSEMYAKYVVLANGANSQLRDKIGITMEGDKAMQHLISIHFFSKDLAQLLMKQPAMLYFIFNSHVVLVLVAHNIEDGDFVAQIPYFPPLQSPTDFSSNTCSELIKKAAGQNLKMNIVSVKSWTMRSQVASAYNFKNVFLAGDSAHVFPPAGGFGMNTGIQDAHNLAWKLAAMVSGNKAEQSLLDTYNTERRPVAQFNSNLSVSNWNEAIKLPSALGLNPYNARIFSDLISMMADTVVPKSFAKNLLETGLFIGRSLSGLRGPLKWWRKREINKIIKSGDTLRLQYPKEDLGFCYELKTPNLNIPSFSKSAGSKLFSKSKMEDSYAPEILLGCRMPHLNLKSLDLKSEVSIFDYLNLSNNDPTLLVSFDISDKNPQITDQLLDHLRDSGVNVVMILSLRDAMRNSKISIKYESCKKYKNEILIGVDHCETWERLAVKKSITAVLVRPDGHVFWTGLNENFTKENLTFIKNLLKLMYS